MLSPYKLCDCDPFSENFEIALRLTNFTKPYAAKEQSLRSHCCPSGLLPNGMCGMPRWEKLTRQFFTIELTRRLTAIETGSCLVAPLVRHIP